MSQLTVVFKLSTFLFYIYTNLILNLEHINNQLRGINEKNN
jgi:hypothetical protein